jgi:hypothetical protein
MLTEMLKLMNMTRLNSFSSVDGFMQADIRLCYSADDGTFIIDE